MERWRMGWAFEVGAVGRIWGKFAGGWLAPAVGRIGGLMMGRGANVALPGQDWESKAQLAVFEGRGAGG